MFSGGPFSAVGFSVSDEAVPSGITGGNVIIYFNNSFLDISSRDKYSGGPKPRHKYIAGP